MVSHKTLQEFFKVFLPNTGSTQLQIPRSFTKFYNGATPRKATLVDQDRNSWEIYVEKIEERLIFKNGWQQFAKEKDLEEGDFLVFQYDGSSAFAVKIFSKNGCIKVAEPATSGAVDPIVILDQSCTIKKRGPSEGACSKSKRAYVENGNHIEIKPRLAKGFPVKDPHFEIIFISWKLRVELPGKLIQKLNIKLNPKMNIRDGYGNIWPVAIITENNRQFFGDGWSNFRQRNNIEKGYRCDFQFVIDKENVAHELLVSVYPPPSKTRSKA
ncbi:hypothetical protein RJT34_19005 [Clitoria ternatea]|uniref:TF-B3 domain-containing protein n=1 Tax=Clitoria ternatea TaxID=43366 RepID=A0AAN9IQF9_CLITE